MQNRSAVVVPQKPAHLLPWRNPNGDFTAAYVDTRLGRTTGQLDTIDQLVHITHAPLADVEAGTFVVLSGTVECVRLFERVHPDYPDADWMYPSATVRMSSGTGADVIVSLNGRHYEDVWGYLVMGRRFGVAGTVSRPEQDAPSVIDFVRLLMTQTDTITPEQYATYARQAVTL